MGFSFNGLSGAAVTISGGITPSLPAPSSTQSVIMIQGTGSGSSQDAYTVTTGKTLYLYGAAFDAGAAASVTYQQYKNDGTTLVLQMRSSSDGKGFQFSGAVPFAVYTSAQIVKITAANNSKYQLWGMEQ